MLTPVRPQDHYDWGLRAIKSVLVVAGSLKRGDPSRAEDQVLMRALRDFNIPKIVTDDLPVFMGLIGDLFPALDVPRKRDLNFEKVSTLGLESSLCPAVSALPARRGHFFLPHVRLVPRSQVQHWGRWPHPPAHNGHTHAAPSATRKTLRPQAASPALASPRSVLGISGGAEGLRANPGLSQ